ncbi:hypothetical protein DC31_10965 [Microbacterium sp. CH12i]|uniref:copper resistance CopC family protein n=1 Tax=Microbacterium sp. CH12i TaxID=1479651 RepID=UPI00046133FA|nr:copper resistance CopC family protein [Microbacterium sp. CH12i]KDA06347.1 hypothetical protein DC31_10965 [Microbacterium sp. CH12i]
MRILTLRHSPAPIALAATLLAAFLLLFAWPQPAAAHDALASSDPAADSTVETLPEQLTLTFSAALIGGDGGTAVVVEDAAGNSVTDGAPELDGAMVIQPLKAEAAAGEYHVLWQVVSSDGHPTSGEFTFNVSTGTAAATHTPTPDATPAPAPSATESALPVAPLGTDEPTDTTPDSSFLDALPWIIGGLIVAAGGGALIAVMTRRGRGGKSDSDASTER